MLAESRTEERIVPWLWHRDDAIYGWLGHRLYCQHGTYVGDPYGPDYMCGVYENDDSIYEYALDQARSGFGFGHIQW